MTSKQGSVEHGREPPFFHLETRVLGGKGVRAHLLHAQQRVTNCLPQGIPSCIFPCKETLCDVFYGSPNGMLLIFKRVVVKWDPQKSR